MSMYKMFETDPGLEKDGVWLDYTTFRVKVARAGGANKEYEKLALEIFKPYKRALDHDVLGKGKTMELLRELVARACVKGWQVKDKDDNWVDGIDMPDGSVGKPTVENICAAFEAVEPVFRDIKEQAEKHTAYRKERLESEEGN